MAIKRFSVNAADNGFVLSYCEETKSVGDGTYTNTNYKDHEKVYTDPQSLMKGIADVVGKLTNKDGKPLVMKIEVEEEGE